MAWRTNTPRTLREAFGHDVTLHEDHPALRWPRPEVLFTAAAAAICAYVYFSQQDETAVVKAAACEYVSPTLDGQHIWHCRDGWRVNNTRGDAL